MWRLYVGGMIAKKNLRQQRVERVLEFWIIESAPFCPYRAMP
jgi:hypothetical protein